MTTGKNVHGPLCARLPGQYQYWQYHLANSEGGIWPTIPGIEDTYLDEEQCNGIAELTFASEADRQAFFQSSEILMADEHNLFSKAIGYNTLASNSVTYLDRLSTGDPNGKRETLSFHILVRKTDDVSISEFRNYLTNSFAANLIKSDRLLKLRLHLLESLENSRFSPVGVSHYEPEAKQYQAAIEVAFADALEMEQFFASIEYATATKDMAKYVKHFFPLTERSAYTFVYEGKMTLAGQCSSKVAELIVRAGATNQLKEEVMSLMKDRQNNQSSLGNYLQGVQHFGVTVEDMAQAREFYTEVLGGKVVVREDNLVGDIVQNTLFQKEELDAIKSGIDPEKVDIPHLRSGERDSLDVEFISFGNTVVELLQVKQAKTNNTNASSVGSIPSHIGHINAMHLSFNVKEGIDLNLFAQKLEAECHRRGITNVVCNRVVQVKSDAERQNVALKYNSFKFWNEDEEDAEIDWSEDPMEGWSLFYCKGPSGEQLEFNQVTRKVKTLFQQGVREYNQANGTNFTFSDAKVNVDNLNQEKTNPTLTPELDELNFAFSSSVDASLETVWEIVVDKIANTSRYNPEANNPEILTTYEDGMLRQMKALGMTVKERIVIDRAKRVITHYLVDNPFFTGKIINQLVQNPHESLTINYVLDWKPINQQGKQIAAQISDKIQQAVRSAVLSAKEVAEKQDNQQPLFNSTNRNITMLETLPGKNTDLVKRLFSRGEAFDSEGFITFFTDKPLYQFGNFEICFDKSAIKQSAENFFSQINAVYHEIKMIQEVGNLVFVEMDVLYWRKDNSMVALPCFDIFRVEGDKFSELRIFMDVNPVFDPSIPVPDSASVLTVSGNQKLLAPGVMRKHFAEHPEGKQRVADGYIPKWSIDGPRWSIEEQDRDLSEQLTAVSELFSGVISQNWPKVKSSLTDDILYKFGSGEPRYGRQEVVDCFTETFRTTAVLTGYKTRKIWQEPDVISIEMDAYYTLVANNKQVIISRCDIYRLRGNQISEWRVYADMSPWQESQPQHGVVRQEVVGAV